MGSKNLQLDLRRLLKLDRPPHHDTGKKGMLNQQGTRKLRRKISASVNSDRIKEGCERCEQHVSPFGVRDLEDAWQCLKGWYTMVLDISPKPCHDSMDRQIVEKEELY